MKINVDGIQVVITRKKVRRITLRVNADGTLSVSAPNGVSEEYIISFVRSKLEWVNTVIDRRSEGPFLSKNFNEGDKITVLGNTYTVKIVKSGKNYIETEGEEIVFCLNEKGYAKRGEVFRKWAEFALRQTLNESLKKWYDLTGLDCSDITVKNMKSRWGSCNVLTKKIAFSLRLITQSKECVDYVVLHELAHTLYRNHDRVFYGFVARFMPRYKSVSKALKMPVEI